MDDHSELLQWVPAKQVQRFFLFFVFFSGVVDPLTIKLEYDRESMNSHWINGLKE